MNLRLISCIALIAFIPLFTSIGCSRHTDNPNAKVVALRNSIIDLVEGRIDEVRGYTATGEVYVLLDGYMSDPKMFDPLPISATLRGRLAEISAPNEMYGLARVRGDSIQEYTYFAHGWPRDPKRNSSPLIIATCPMLINGQTYIIKKDTNAKSQLVLKVNK